MWLRGKIHLRARDGKKEKTWQQHEKDAHEESQPRRENKRRRKKQKTVLFCENNFFPISSSTPSDSAPSDSCKRKENLNVEEQYKIGLMNVVEGIIRLSVLLFAPVTITRRNLFLSSLLSGVESRIKFSHCPNFPED
jgi:hypothetical protein